MSLVTAVMVGNDESECVKLGSAAMADGLRDEEDMSAARDALELEVEVDRLLDAIGSARGGVYVRAEERTKTGDECLRTQRG